MQVPIFDEDGEQFLSLSMDVQMDCNNYLRVGFEEKSWRNLKNDLPKLPKLQQRSVNQYRSADGKSDVTEFVLNVDGEPTAVRLTRDLEGSGMVDIAIVTDGRFEFDEASKSLSISTETSAFGGRFIL